MSKYDDWLESCCDEGCYSERDSNLIDEYLDNNLDEVARDKGYVNIRDLEALQYNTIRDIISNAFNDVWRLHDYKDPVVLAIIEQYRARLLKQLEKEMNK